MVVLDKKNRTRWATEHWLRTLIDDLAVFRSTYTGSMEDFFSHGSLELKP